MAFTPINLLAMMVSVLVLNSAVVRLGLPRRVPAIYWIVQGMNAAIIVAVMVWGIPGLHGQAKLINWIIALVVGMHMVQNVSARLAATAEARRAALDAEWEALHRRADEERASKARTPAPDQGAAGAAGTSGTAGADP